MAHLPYNPTVLLHAPKTSEVLYVLDSGTGDSTKVRLRGLDISSSLSIGNLAFKDIDGDVPFGGTEGTSYSTFISDNGTIYAFAGKCSDGTTGASAWSFTPGNDHMSGSWLQAYVSVVESGNQSTGGANFLAAGVAFSSNLNATSDLYVFGGMCPHSKDASSDTWQSSADYSNTLLQLKQSQSTDSSEYTLDTAASRGPPIPEAGFSITPLSPAYFNHSSGNVTMQQNFVLLGGHTQSAFLNMSQVAVLSLPEETWTFLPVTSTETGNSVDPRSGHTAVLSEDGSKIVLLGGWVGDTNTPADPQLVILEIGEGYGGAGEWQWTKPSTKGQGPQYSGIYGHGATLLAGNILMISGGYQIGSGQGELSRRAPMSDSYLFNMTTNTWVTDYKNPNSDEASTGGATGPNRIGLGAGLAVGVLVVIAILVALLWFRRKKRRGRKIEEKDLQALALGSDQFSSHALGFGGIDGRGGDLNAGPYLGSDGHNAYPWAPTLKNSGPPGQARPSDAERTGLLVEIPSPTRGLRRSLHSRGNHWYEDGRRSRGSGYIHSIDERDEFEPGRGAAASHTGDMVELENTAPIPRPTSRPLSDPFRDPPDMERSLLDGSRTPSPVREIDTPGVMLGVAAGPHLLPEKDRSERTLSTLSEHSMVSALSQQQSVSNDSIGRTQSQRSNTVFSTRPLAPTSYATNPTNPSLTSALGAKHSPGGSISIPPLIARRPVPLGSHPPTRASAALEPGTLQGFSPSSFGQLQAEGPNLLLGSSPDHQDDDFDAEPISRRKPQSRPRSWMGSMRRALAVSASVASRSSGSTSPSPSPRRQAFFAAPESLSNTADGSRDVGKLTQRPVTAEGQSGPWGRPQQGARAWVNDGRNPFGDDTGPIGDWGPGAPQTALQRRAHERGRSDGALADDEDEWDVEGAVERRQVQMMFTVPRDKLRIVNGAPDGDDRSVRSSRSGRSLRRPSQDAPATAASSSSPLGGRLTAINTATLNYTTICEFNEKSPSTTTVTAIPVSTDPPISRAEDAGAESDADSDANFIVHGATDDEAEDEEADDRGRDETPRASYVKRTSYVAADHVPNNEEDSGDANFVVHAASDNEFEDATDNDDELSVKALEWRQRRNLAAERLRQVSGEEAVRKVSGSSEGGPNATT